MQLTVVTALVALLSATTNASPVPSTSTPVLTHQARDVAAWTIKNLRRTCDDKDMQCEWTFTINTHQVSQAPTPCKFVTWRFGEAPASQSPQFGAPCGPYRIGASWSGQFGQGNGFTTLSVKDENYRLIAYPAYTDKQLESGQVVKPDLSFAPHAF